MPRHIQKKAHIIVSLAGVFEGEGDGPKWVQVTREGDFPGYLGGLRPFVFKRADLDQMAANLKAHPAFAVNAAGVATGRVIPWDFNHASEANPTTGDLPVTGAPSQGWTLDMEVRNGADGKAELWALTQFLEPARSYVKGGQYLWASVSVAFNAINAESAQNVGALVTSIALTNTPVVEGMDQLAASRRGVPGAPGNEQEVLLRRTWFEAARDPADAINMMREMFSLPETAGAAEVMVQVAIIQGWLETGTAPLGTNPEELVGNMRLILNLPALTPQIGVIAEAASSIQALLEEQAAAAGVPATPLDTPADDGIVPPPAAVEAAKRRKDESDMDELIKVLASLLGVRENEASIKTAVTELSQLRDQLTLALGLNRDGANIILAAAKEGVDAKARLLALFEALDVADPEAALAKIASTMESAAKLVEVMPELEGLQADAKKVEDASISADVDDAIAASKLPATVKPALLLQRKSDPEEFAKSYPKAAAPAADKKHLLRRVTTDGATPLKTSADGSTVQRDNADGLDAGGDVINLAQLYPQARNPTAAAKMHLAGTVANWDKLTIEDQFKRAVAFKALPNVIDQATA